MNLPFSDRRDESRRRLTIAEPDSEIDVGVRDRQQHLAIDFGDHVHAQEIPSLTISPASVDYQDSISLVRIYYLISFSFRVSFKTCPSAGEIFQAWSLMSSYACTSEARAAGSVTCLSSSKIMASLTLGFRASMMVRRYLFSREM
jgi:hypothetical protein